MVTELWARMPLRGGDSWGKGHVVPLTVNNTVLYIGKLRRDQFSSRAVMGKHVTTFLGEKISGFEQDPLFWCKGKQFLLEKKLSLSSGGRETKGPECLLVISHCKQVRFSRSWDKNLRRE